MPIIRAVEFYSGIGGMRLALERSNVNGVVIRAIDFDHTACGVYAVNHPDVVMKVDVATVTADSLFLPQADLWLLSPPCQPYTVLSSQKGGSDPRAKSFIHLITDVLPELIARNTHPRYLLVENVAAFEISDTRRLLVSTLKALEYTTFECLLTPLQFGVPNSRLRYYLLAKRSSQDFPHSQNHDENNVWRYIPTHGLDGDHVDHQTHRDSTTATEPIRSYLDKKDICDLETYRIPDRILNKWGRLFDIVLPSSQRTCCFTRGYTQLVERAGSILQMNEDLDTKTVFDEFLQAQRDGDQDAVRILKPLKLRYFTPSELLRLFWLEHCDQADAENTFLWPTTVSTRSKYRLIGNSVNVKVVTELINFLFQK